MCRYVVCTVHCVVSIFYNLYVYGRVWFMYNMRFAVWYTVCEMHCVTLSLGMCLLRVCAQQCVCIAVCLWEVDMLFEGNSIAL